jgi:hypothetical protein
MSSWQKYVALPLTITLVSVLLPFFYTRQNCDCDLTPKPELTEPPENESFYDDPHHPDDFTDVLPPLSEISVRPKYWFHIYDDDSYHAFDTVKAVLDRLDCEQITMDLRPNGSFHFGWDLLWSYQYHDLADLPIEWSSMRYHQKMNHIPGNHLLTSKSVFGTTTRSKYVPRAFVNSSDLQAYAKDHPEKLFVTKLKSNRGVRLQKVSDMNFTDDGDLNGYFAQEFIANPLLFNGHKFDFGVYVLVTSVKPLRLFYYTKNMIFRFCPKTYDISDPSDTDRYVVSDSKIPVWEFPGTRDYFEHGYNTRDAFDGFLRKAGADVDGIWFKIEDCIRSIVVSKERFFNEFVSDPKMLFMLP